MHYKLYIQYQFSLRSCEMRVGRLNRLPSRRVALGRCLVAFMAAVSIGAGAPARAAEVLAGPFPAQVVRVVDGDTIEVSVRIWLGQTIQTRVRLAGMPSWSRSRHSAINDGVVSASV